MQMAISPHLVFNTWQSTRDWCLGENVLPHYLHNQQIFPFWLLVLSLIMEQLKILIKGGSSGSSSSPTNDKSAIEVNAVSVETVVSCNCRSRTNREQMRSTHLEIDWYGWAGSMFSCSLWCGGRCCEMQCCEMLFLDDGYREEYLCVERIICEGCKKVTWLNGLFIIYTCQFVRWLLRTYLWYLEKIWRKSAISDTK